MGSIALVMMIVVLGLIWGGLVFTINLAIRKEKSKK